MYRKQTREKGESDLEIKEGRHSLPVSRNKEDFHGEQCEGRMKTKETGRKNNDTDNANIR